MENVVLEERKDCLKGKSLILIEGLKETSCLEVPLKKKKNGVFYFKIT